MRSHHLPGDSTGHGLKLPRFVLKEKIGCPKSKQAAFHPGPVLPPSGEGSPLGRFAGYYAGDYN